MKNDRDKRNTEQEASEQEPAHNEPLEEELSESLHIDELIKQEESDQEEESYRTKYLRQLADMENMRKRLQEEKQQTISFAVDNIITDFLYPLDQLEQALEFASSHSDEIKNWAQGFTMILAQFKGVLAQHHIESFDSVGLPFDPHKHEAIERIETNDYKEGTVVTEVVKGYRKKDRIIRHARVKVAAKASNIPPSQQEPNEGVNHE